MHDVGVIQCCQCLGLTEEALTELGVAQMFFQDDFDGLRAIEEDVLRFIDLAKASIAQEFAEPIFIAQCAVGKLTLRSHSRKILPDSGYETVWTLFSRTSHSIADG